MQASSVRLEISSDFAPAAYFVMASWRNPDTAPQLETADGPLRIRLHTTEEAISDLREAVRLVGSRTPALALSAGALLQAFERRLGAAAEV